MKKCSFPQALRQLASEEKIQVEFYAGSKGEELPRQIRLDEDFFQVDEVLESRRELRLEEARWREIFICRVDGFLTKLEKHPSGQWRIKLIE